MKDTLDTSGTALLLELGHAVNRNGLTPAELKWLTQGDNLSKFLPVIRGMGEITVVKHIIDLAADPYIPNNWKVEHHEKGVSDFEFDPTKVRLHLSKNQEGTKSVEGHKLREELANEPVLNANLLDYLLKNPHLIPEEWKRKYVFFWGTIYRASNGDLYVRALSWHGSGWFWNYSYLGRDFDSDNPAACLAK